MTSRTSARFSTYSGAPSLQPSLAPTYNTSTSQRNSAAPTERASDEKLALPQQQQQQRRRPYNTTPSVAAAAASTSTLSNSTDPKAADIKSWSGALERMQDERLDAQRYTMSSNKSDEVSKLALGAKVERALARRMVGQDAVFSRGGSGSGRGEKRKEVEAL